jgi:hypothetical protein
MINKEIKKWLDKNATLLQEAELNNRGYISIYGTDCGCVIVQEFNGDAGCEVYIPASNDNKIDTTIIALNNFINPPVSNPVVWVCQKCGAVIGCESIDAVEKKKSEHICNQ